MGNSLGSWIILRNNTRKTLTTSVSSVSNYDWQGNDRPDHKCHNRTLHPNQSMEELLQMNGNANGNPYTLTLNFNDGTNLVLRINQRHVQKGHAPRVEGGHTSLYHFEYTVDWQKWKIIITISDSAHSIQQAKEEAQRKEREEAAKKAREEAAKKAREEAERKAREEAAKKAREEAEKKAIEEAAKKAKEEAAKKAREEAEKKAREEAEKNARDEAEKKAKEEAEKKVREEAEKKEAALDAVSKATAIFEQGVVLAADNKKESALESFDEAMEKLNEVTSTDLVVQSLLSNAYLKLINAYVKNEAYDEAHSVIAKVKLLFPEKEASLKAAEVMIETNNWSPDYLHEYLDSVDQTGEDNVIAIGEVSS